MTWKAKAMLVKNLSHAGRGAQLHACDQNISYLNLSKKDLATLRRDGRIRRETDLHVSSACMYGASHFMEF